MDTAAAFWLRRLASGFPIISHLDYKECNDTRAPENALVCEILFQLLISEIVSLNFNDLRKGSPMFDMDKLLLSLVAVQVNYMLSLWGNNDDTFGKEDSSLTINGISVVSSKYPQFEC